MTRKLINRIKYIFMAAGLALIVFGFTSYNSTRSFIVDASQAEGQVVDLVRQRKKDKNASSGSSTTYKPVVAYTTANGYSVEFMSTVGSNPPSHQKGEMVKVLYDPNNPENARIDSFLHLWFTSSLLAGMGALFAFMGGGMALFAKLRQRKNAMLQQTGVRILTNFQRVEGVSGNKSSRIVAFRIVSQWVNPTTSQLHVFKSEALSFDPTDHIKSDQVTVFIEKDNPRKYFVDTRFLPSLAD